ncbi:MAG: hypothetical protein ACXWXC_07240, partial [Aeromicrobium sp.]
FGPISTPLNEFISLPDSVKVQIVSSEFDVSLLDALLEEPFIGVDLEWRPEIFKYDKSDLSIF